MQSDDSQSIVQSLGFHSFSTSGSGRSQFQIGNKISGTHFYNRVDAGHMHAYE